MNDYKPAAATMAIELVKGIFWLIAWPFKTAYKVWKKRNFTIILLLLAFTSCKEENTFMEGKWGLSFKKYFNPIGHSVNFSEGDIWMSLEDSNTSVKSNYVVSIGSKDYQWHNNIEDMLILQRNDTTYMYLRPGSSYWKNKK